MRIQVLSEDLVLVEELRKVESFNVSTIRSVEEINGDVLIISDRMVDHNDLHLYLNDNNRLVFFLVSNRLENDLTKQIKAVCDSLNVIMIQPRLATKQIVQEVVNVIFPQTSSDASKVISIFSSVSNIGTTSTTLSIGRALARYAPINVAVISLNAWDDGSDSIRDFKGSYLNEMKTQLANETFEPQYKGNFNEDPFIKAFHTIKRPDSEGAVYFLAGNRNIKLERMYTVEEVNYLIELAKERFDIVLLDSGSHFDNALIYQSLKHSDMKLLIINQQRKAIKKFNEIYNSILFPLGIEKSHLLLVINSLREDPGYPTAKELYQELSISHLSSIPFMDYIGIQSEAIGTLLYDYQNDEYNDSIERIARAVAFRSGISLNFREGDTKGQKKGWLSFIKG